MLPLYLNIYLFEKNEDFEMSVKLSKEINPDYLWVGKFSPVSGSEYYEENKENSKHMKWDDYSYFYGKSSDEIEKRHKKIVREFYLRPIYLINFLKRFSFLELGYYCQRTNLIKRILKWVMSSKRKLMNMVEIH